jgi:hypothetical protein
MTEQGEGMKIVFEDGTPCTSFKDVAHLNSHIKFFNDHHKMGFNMALDATTSSGEMHIIKEGVLYLTSEGSVALTILCTATTAFGALRRGEKAGLVRMKVDSMEGALSAVAGTVPEYSILRPKAYGNADIPTLNQECTFEKVDVADESTILASTGPGPVGCEVKVSPAILSLFLHGGLAEKRRQPEELKGQHLWRHLCEPPVNTRTSIIMKRLYDEKVVAVEETKTAQHSPTVMSDEAGLVVTAMGKGRHGNTFSGHCFYVLAYSIASNADVPEESAKVCSFECAMDMPATLEGDPRAKTITKAEVLQLWDLLFSGMDEVQIQRPDNTDTDTEASATKAFSMLLATMQLVYGGLKTCQDWSKLYLQLSSSNKLSEYNLGRVLASLTWPERNFMVYAFMGVITRLRISLLDGLGRVSATKLACISRYPQVSREDLTNPNLSFVSGGVPNFGVVGQEAVVRCISLNQGPDLNRSSIEMCSGFSDGILQRVNQPTRTGIMDFLNEFLIRAATDKERQKFWCGATAAEMTQGLEKRRIAAYHCILDNRSNNWHLKELQKGWYTSTRKTLQSLIDWCTLFKLGKAKNGLCHAHTDKGHEVLKWLVAILVSGFYFPTEDPAERNKDRSYSQMLILVRKNGFGTPKKPKEDFLYAETGRAFKVCSHVCVVLERAMVYKQ